MNTYELKFYENTRSFLVVSVTQYIPYKGIEKKITYSFDLRITRRIYDVSGFYLLCILICTFEYHKAYYMHTLTSINS